MFGIFESMILRTFPGGICEFPGGYDCSLPELGYFGDFLEGLGSHGMNITMKCTTYLGRCLELFQASNISRHGFKDFLCLPPMFLGLNFNHHIHVDFFTPPKTTNKES